MLVHLGKKSSADVLFLTLKTFLDHYSKVNFIPERSFNKILKTPTEYPQSGGQLLLKKKSFLAVTITVHFSTVVFFHPKMTVIYTETWSYK